MREPARFQNGFRSKFNAVLVSNCAHYFQHKKRMIDHHQPSPGFGQYGTVSCIPASTPTRSSAVSTRQRVKQVHSLQDRLTSFAQDAREKASLLPPGAEKDAMLEKARQAEAALRFDDWANSSGLQPPK
jgi:hypothetical protein